MRSLVPRRCQLDQTQLSAVTSPRETRILAHSLPEFAGTRGQGRTVEDWADDCAEEPLFEKGARAPPQNSLWEKSGPNSSELRKVMPGINCLHEEQVARTCPKNSNWFEFLGLVAGTKVGPRATRFWSENGQFTRWNLSPRLVAGTSPLVCADFKSA